VNAARTDEGRSVPPGLAGDIGAIELEIGSERVPAEPLMLTGSGVVVGVRQPDAPILAESAPVSLILRGADPGAPTLALRAIVRASVLTATHCRYRLRLVDPEELPGLRTRLPSSPDSCIERRMARRVAADPDLEVAVSAPGVPTVLARLRDISATGLSVILPAAEDREPLPGGCGVDLRFYLPLDGRTITLRGYVRRGLMIDQHVCYGIQFDPGGSSAYRRQQAALARYIARRYLVERGRRLARACAS
jgi:hypothetical protein